MHLGKGNQGYNFITTNLRTYPNKDPNTAIVPPNKDFIASIKSHHFEVGPNKPRDHVEMTNAYTSEAKLKYNLKGNSAEIRSTLDEAKKSDLRRNHFGIGGPTANFLRTTGELDYRPMTAKQIQESRPSLNQERMNQLRASHWGVAHQCQSLGNSRFARNAQSSKTMPTANKMNHFSSAKKSTPARPDSAFVTTSMVNYRWVQPFPSSKIF